MHHTEHATQADALLREADQTNHTDPRAAQRALLAQGHALLGIYGLLEQMATPHRYITGLAEDQR